MAFFKFRPGAHAGSEKSASGAETQTVELLRRKARQRLIGATVLVVLAVAGFPLLFDTQPRPVPVDLSIDIPAKAKVSPEVPPEPLKPGSGAGDAAPASAADEAQHSHALSDKEELVATTAAPAKTDAPKADSGKSDSGKSEAPKAAVPVVAATPAKPAADKARDEPSAARFVVQVGAYADEAKVREVRAKLEKAGLKTYTQVIETKDGKRTRVRVGPFPNKAEAEKVLDKAKSLQLQASILSY